MGFKTITDYQEEMYGGMFILRNDGDSANAIFLYRSLNDVLVTNAHYIKSSEYSGYVHCLGKGCPACAYGQNGIKVQPKMFIPMYLVDSDEIVFWDRSVRFQQQMETDVFSKFPNPSEFIFTITRHGAAGDINTRYEIMAKYRNTSLPYDKILADHNLVFPDYFENVCKTWSAAEYNEHLNPVSVNSAVDTDTMPEYKISPRTGVSATAIPDLPEVEDAFPEYPEMPVSKPAHAARTIDDDIVGVLDEDQVDF